MAAFQGSIQRAKGGSTPKNGLVVKPFLGKAFRFDQLNSSSEAENPADMASQEFEVLRSAASRQILIYRPHHKNIHLLTDAVTGMNDQAVILHIGVGVAQDFFHIIGIESDAPNGNAIVRSAQDRGDTRPGASTGTWGFAQNRDVARPVPDEGVRFGGECRENELPFLARCDPFFCDRMNDFRKELIFCQV